MTAWDHHQCPKLNYTTHKAIMEVTRTNFEEMLPAICASLAKAAFVAIDCEFSGLAQAEFAVVGQQRATRFDTPVERFQRASDSAANFSLMQLGVCAFEYDAATRALIAHPYSIHCFPRGGADKRFMCQTSSMQFLDSHGFNFQTWVHDGVSFLTHHEEAALVADEQARAEKVASFADITGASEPSIAVSAQGTTRDRCCFCAQSDQDKTQCMSEQCASSRARRCGVGESVANARARMASGGDGSRRPATTARARCEQWIFSQDCARAAAA